MTTLSRPTTRHSKKLPSRRAKSVLRRLRPPRPMPSARAGSRQARASAVSARREVAQGPREGRMTARLRTVGLTLLIVVVLLGLDFGLESLIPDSSIRQLLMLAAVYVMVAVSLNVINGMAGQFSIGHAGFVGIGAYTAAVVASNLNAGSTLSSGPGMASFAHGWFLVPISVGRWSAGFFALRPPRGSAELAPSRRLPRDRDARLCRNLSSGHCQRAVQRHHRVLPARLVAGRSERYAGSEGQGVPLFAGPFWVFGAAILMTVATWRIKFSGWGRALRALREDEIAAAAVGVDPTRYKVISIRHRRIRRRRRRGHVGDDARRSGARSARPVQLPVLLRRHHHGDPRRIGERQRRGDRRPLRDLYREVHRAHSGRRGRQGRFRATTPGSISMPFAWSSTQRCSSPS